ncbi:ThuA domain-containing protein [Amnibacterium endophyticum]|uniref:ThuA domain-containing protein n=1 Tax=Amnibacterium endophyticum TaxID=2109337 RepID=A0ABW4LE85_9MICO
MRITVWNENVHETRGDDVVRELYPEGIHGQIAKGLAPHFADDGDVIRTAVLQDDEHGLTEQVLDETDVLLWWGHIAHDQVSDEVVERVHRRVLAGMGLLVMHSGHYSKIFTRITGSTASLLWRSEGERELVWTIERTHPIAAGIPNPIVIPRQEMYGEPFDIPVPDELVFVSSFTGGEVFRSGVTYTRGLGRIFYFSPGDQEYPVYHQAEILQVLANGIRWAAPRLPREDLTAEHRPTGWFAP